MIVNSDKYIKFSIIIPTYNRGYCISDAINSVIEQSYKEFELIVVDDASQDNTLEVLRNFSVYDIKVIKNYRNQGCNASKNNGAFAAKGDYLIFLDSDDRLFNSTTLKQISHELRINGFPKIAMFSSVNFQNVKVHQEFDTGFVTYKDYLREKRHGEFLPLVNRLIFLNYNFPTEIVGGEGITWRFICKEFKSMYFSCTPSRLYNDISSDRLSYRSKSNSLRIMKVYIFQLRYLFWDYLVLYQMGLLRIALGLVYNFLHYLRFSIVDFFKR